MLYYQQILLSISFKFVIQYNFLEISNKEIISQVFWQGQYLSLRFSIHPQVHQIKNHKPISSHLQPNFIPTRQI